jgi:hypothetical protein
MGSSRLAPVFASSNFLGAAVMLLYWHRPAGVHGQPASGFMALVSGPSYGLAQMPADKERRINVHFRIPFMTQWGQSIVLTGTGEAGPPVVHHSRDHFP